METLLKWMIWGYHYFRKHPYIHTKNLHLPHKSSKSGEYTVHGSHGYGSVLWNKEPFQGWNITETPDLAHVWLLNMRRHRHHHQHRHHYPNNGTQHDRRKNYCILSSHRTAIPRDVLATWNHSNFVANWFVTHRKLGSLLTYKLVINVSMKNPVATSNDFFTYYV